MSYRAQVEALFRLHVDVDFRAAFQDDPGAAAPLLSEGERRELLRLPFTARAAPQPTSGAPTPAAESAFARVGVRARCRLALPRTYAALEQLAAGAGFDLDADLERRLWHWTEAPPAGYERDSVQPNPELSWAEAGNVLQLTNRVYWQFHGYAVALARTRPAAPPYLAELARFEFDTLAARVALYARFRAPGPAAGSLVPEARPRLSRYASLAHYAWTMQAAPVPQASAVVFLYDGKRLRALQLAGERGQALAALDGTRELSSFDGATARLLHALAAVGAVEAA